VPCRLERIECGQPFGVFVDHGQSPGPLAHALQTLRAVTPGRGLCVLPAAADLDRFEHIRLGRIAAQLADQTVVTRSAIGQSSPHAPREGIISRSEMTTLAGGSAGQPALLNDVVLGAKNKASVLTIADRAEAIRWTLGSAEEGDCVLVAGVSTAAAASDEDALRSGDDRWLIRRVLRDEAPASYARRAVA
jgi:UDP-N-acetylmuramoyl-L-alanyl-D-glutamate--2,6-diaminopimelate ligase